MSGVNVVQRSQRILLESASKTVSVINAGPMGPGVGGAPGTGVVLQAQYDSDKAVIQGDILSLQNDLVSHDHNGAYYTKSEVDAQRADDNALAVTLVQDLETSLNSNYTFTGQIKVYHTANQALILDGPTGVRPYIAFYENGDRKGYIGYPSAGATGDMTFISDSGDARIVCGSGKRVYLPGGKGLHIDCGSVPGSGWGDANLVIEGGASGNVAISMKVDAYAPQIRCGASNNVNFRDSTDSNWATVRAIISNQSDGRLKELVSPLYEGSHERLMALRPVSFRWNRSETTEGPAHVCDSDCLKKELTPACHDYQDWLAGELGFIAQEVGMVDPRLAYRDEEGVFSGLNLPGLIALLVDGYASLHDRISALEEGK